MSIIPWKFFKARKVALTHKQVVHNYSVCKKLLLFNVGKGFASRYFLFGAVK